MLALATIMGPVAPGYAGEPCCAWIYGKYINLKTGKEVKPPKGAVAPGPVENAASPAEWHWRRVTIRSVRFDLSDSEILYLSRSDDAEVAVSAEFTRARAHCCAILPERRCKIGGLIGSWRR